MLFTAAGDAPPGRLYGRFSGLPEGRVASPFPTGVKSAGESPQLHSDQYRGREPVPGESRHLHRPQYHSHYVNLDHGLTPAVLTTWNWEDSPRTG